MADYHPLIARAVEGLGTSSGEARRSLYERARAALVAQLRGIDPPLSEADITRERLALEDAIRKVEAETVRKSRTEPRPAPPLRPQPRGPVPPPPPPAPPQPAVQPAPPMPRRDGRQDGRPDTRQDLRQDLRPDMRPDMRPEPRPDMQRAESPLLRAPTDLATDEGINPSGPPTARNRLLNARTSPAPREGLKSLRNVVNEVDDLGTASAQAARSARDTRDFYGNPSPQHGVDDDAPPLRNRVEPNFGDDDADLLNHAPQMRSLEPSYHIEDEDAAFPPPGRRGYGPEHDEHYEEPRPPRSYRGIAQLAALVIILGGVIATVSWQWSNISHLYQFFSHLRARPTQTAQAPTAEPKFSGRVPQDQGAGTQAGSGPASTQAGPAVAQRVVLYQEDPNNPQGKQFVGSAVWRTETVSPGTGLAPELEVRADIEIPEQHMTVTWTLRRNTDQALPASHTIEIMFNVPQDFPGGGVANVPGVLMKESEQARGTPLAGLAVKVTNGFFLIGLSAVDADLQRNIQLLKTRPWFDIPIVYNNGGRAILALEKGPPGDRAFADAFAAWGN